MTILHHPSQETLVAFVGGTLGEGNNLVVVTHLADCRVCREQVRDMGELGGGLLEQGDAVAIAAETRDAVLAKLDDTPIDAASEASDLVLSDKVRADKVMAPLSLYDKGKWRWVGPGVYHQLIDVPNDDGTRVFMLKAAPGTRLPDHRHVGTEWTCVIKGAFRHDHGRFGAGDFDEADDSVDHNPYVEEGEECICLVALNGHVEMTGWLGRLIQPMVRL